MIKDSLPVSGFKIKAWSLIMILNLAILPFFNVEASNKTDLRPFEKWQYLKEIKIIGNPKAGEFIKVNLDKEVFGHAKSDLGDLRLAGGNLSEIPYKLIIEKNNFTEENIYPVQFLNNSFVPEQYNLFVVDFGKNGYLNSSLRILTSSENFRRSAEISGSDDMVAWSILKTDGYIYDYTDIVGKFKAQNTNINYPENAYRYIQVKIFIGGDGEPLKITGAQVSRVARSDAKETVFTPKFEIKEDFNKKTTDIIIDLEKKGWPTSGVSIVSSNENFNRVVGVYESPNKIDWKIIGQGYIFNYNAPKFKGSNSNIDYPESGDRYLKIEIYNGSDKPLSVNNLFVKTVLRNIIFQYRQGENYTLYYGNAGVRFPEYDLEKVFPYLDTGRYTSAELSVEKNNPIYQKEIFPEKPLTERIPYLLEIILGFAVAVMGFLVFRFMKKTARQK